MLQGYIISVNLRTRKAPDKEEREEDREEGWESAEMDPIAIYRNWRQKEEGTVMKRYVNQSNS